MGLGGSPTGVGRGGDRIEEGATPTSGGAPGGIINSLGFEPGANPARFIPVAGSPEAPLPASPPIGIKVE